MSHPQNVVDKECTIRIFIPTHVCGRQVHTHIELFMLCTLLWDGNTYKHLLLYSHEKFKKSDYSPCAWIHELVISRLFSSTYSDHVTVTRSSPEPQ